MLRAGETYFATRELNSNENRILWPSFIEIIKKRYVSNLRRVQFQQSQKSRKWKVATIGATFSQRSPLLNQ